jgi:sulfur-oxidizing protein SoxA
LAREGHDLLALSSFVAHQSRGLPIAPPEDTGMRAVRALGQSIYTTRLGQLDLSCAQCHDDHAGRRLAGSSIPQAHPTGYPIYRLEWQSVGSLQRRLRGCMVGVRAEPFAYGSPEFIAIEAFLMERARGMELETPAIRP